MLMIGIPSHDGLLIETFLMQRTTHNGVVENHKHSSPSKDGGDESDGVESLDAEKRPSVIKSLSRLISPKTRS